MKYFKKSLVCLFLLTALSAHAERIAEDSGYIDANAALSNFTSINQLGELKLTIPQSHYFKTTHGVPVVFTPMHNLPIVDIDVNFSAGNGHDDQIRKGANGDIAKMTATMMAQGTKTLDEEAFHEKADSYAMSASFSSSFENFVMSLRVIKEDNTLDEALGLLLEAYQNPRFDETVLARNKAQAVLALKAAEESPSFLAERALSGIIEKNNPKAYDDAAKNLQKLKRSELVAYKNKFLVAKNAKIAITGDLTLEEATQIATRIANAMPVGKTAVLDVKLPKVKPIHYHINHPSTQTYVLIAGIAPTVKPVQEEIQRHNDYRLANAILAGGDFNSRLMQEIRVKKGYTYGIGGGLDYNSLMGIYSIDFSVKNEQASEAIADTLATVQTVLESGVRQDELDSEIAGAKNAYPTRFGSHSGVHRAVSGVFFDDYPNDYLATRFERLDKASLQSANEALRYFVLPKNFMIITVGQTKPVVKLPSQN